MLARYIDPIDRALTKQVTAINDREAQASALIARALLAVFGNSVAPDATFSLRISDGQVVGYPYNGTDAPPFTTFYGMYDRYYGFGPHPAWNLMPRWLAARDSVNLATPLDAVSTTDIIGGNSGRPVINRDGELVGLIFDGNIEARRCGSSSRRRWAGPCGWIRARIIEALRHVYDAGALADEMTGSHSVTALRRRYPEAGGRSRPPASCIKMREAACGSRSSGPAAWSGPARCSSAWPTTA